MPEDRIQLPNWMFEFMHQNPYPSLAFLPIQHTDKEEIVFFYQNEESELAILNGQVKMTVCMYEEEDAYVFRMDFYPVETYALETKGVAFIEHKVDNLYAECLFSKNDLHKNALRQLTTQAELFMILYDRKTRYLRTATIDFSEGRGVLRTFIETHNL